MKILIGKILFFSLALSQLHAQATSDAANDVENMKLVLKEAGELQSTEPVSAAEKLAPLLATLRQLRESGALKPDVSKVFKDALLLMARTQTMLLAPEDDIMAFFRELLIVDPQVDESVFNPREKLLLKTLRSTESGNLSLETNPSGVILSYLGIEMGKTPGKFELIAGSYRFHLRLPGYLDQDIELTIKPAEVRTMSLVMRRRVVDIPIAINAPSTTIRLNGKNLGASQTYNAWLGTLPSEQKPEYEAIVKQWKTDLSSASFSRLTEVPVGESIRIEFQAACYQPLSLELKVVDKDVNWTRVVHEAPQLRNVQLIKDTGYIEATSTPSGADVWIDGNLQGKTPFEGKEVCSGMHRVQVIHSAGQYVQDVTIQQGRTMRVNGQVKPALAFLGVYEQNSKNSELILATADSKAIAKNLALNCRAFADPLIMPDDVELLRKKESLPIDKLLQDSAVAMDQQIRKASTAFGRSDLLLLGLRTEKGYVFRLYSTMHPTPDIIEVARLDDTSINFLISQLNKVERIKEHLRIIDFGLELADSPKGLIISNISSEISSLKSSLAPGLIVKSIDEKPMTFKESQRYLRSKKPEQTVVFEVQTAQGKVSLVPVTLRQMGTEYPWSTPDGFSNSVLATLRYFVELDPLSDDSKLAALSLARGFMRLKEWKLALEFLARANFELKKNGICPGTVLYYQGRCYEEMGNRAQAESYYTRAKDYAEATMGTPNGLSVQILADQRLQVLKKR
jgi:hypothetical protein